MTWGLLFGWLSACWRGFVKAVRHAATGKCEIERVCCAGGYHSAAMSRDFAACLFNSRQLKSLSDAVFNFKLFSVSGSVDVIVTKKRIPMKGPQEQIVVANVAHCLHALKYFNMCADKLIGLKDTAFDATAVSHVELLESFWSCMQPGELRRPASAGSIASDDWGKGRDPSTDFRGMGLLGLVQLEYFARSRPSQAQAALRNSMHPRRYYPFAATGINITSFVLELARNRHLHVHMFKTLEINTMQHRSDAAEGPCSSPALVDIGLSAFHDLYCDVYTAFDSLWTERDPKDVMAFPIIFSELKECFKHKYPQLAEKGHTYYYHN